MSDLPPGRFPFLCDLGKHGVADSHAKHDALAFRIAELIG
jgi:hypothetical protein